MHPSIFEILDDLTLKYVTLSVPLPGTVFNVGDVVSTQEEIMISSLRQFDHFLQMGVHCIAIVLAKHCCGHGIAVNEHVLIGFLNHNILDPEMLLGKLCELI